LTLRLFGGRSVTAITHDLAGLRNIAQLLG
jgi:hypothetical protein